MIGADIILVKPGSQKELYGELSAFKLTAIEPPLWGALLAAYLRKLGYRVELIDAEVENLSYRQTAERIKDAKPLLAAIVVSGTNPSASTMNMTGAGAILAFLLEISPEISTILTGLHPSALPEHTLREEKADFVCQGEGFFTLPPLLDTLKARGAKYQIPGLWYRKDGGILGNPRPAPYQNLDDLPMPAWDLLPMEKYRAHNWHCFDRIQNRQPYVAVYTSLGCPFHCSFCCINALFGKAGIRYRSPQRVIEEIDFLVNRYGLRNIKIIDEMFAMNEARVTQVCDPIIQRGYDLNFWAYARVNTVTPGMLGKMKEAGINWVAYGFESGNKRVLENATKGYKLDAVGKVVQITYSLGMHICANFIFGLPEDDFDSMHETLKLMLDINAEWANIYAAMAYPGSQLYELAIENKWPLPESWQAYSQYRYETLPLPTRYLTGGQVLAYRDYAFETYYRSPRYLDMISKKFTPGIATHIQEMAAKTIPRKFATY
jgi:anaerobic magnesium-protoporphyrin IX monomethyl ester cyclase